MDDRYDGALAKMADRRITEWLAKQDLETTRKAEANMARLRLELGLAPGASLWAYLTGSSSSSAEAPLERPANDEAADAIEDFFQSVERVLVDGEPWEQHFKPRGGRE